MGLELDYIYGQTPISEEEKEGLLIKSITRKKYINSLHQADDGEIKPLIEFSRS